MQYANQIPKIINAFSPAPLKSYQMDQFYCKGTMQWNIVQVIDIIL